MRWPNGSQTQPRISSNFGPRVGGAYSVHYGVDFIGFTDIIAVAGGKVTTAGWLNPAAGNTVAVDIAPGVTVVYMHLASVSVKRGDVIAEGDKLGIMGASGNATGVCLHFEVRVNAKSVDPLAWARARFATPASSGSSSTSGKWPARTLKGEAWVKSAQTKLRRLGYPKLTVDGYDGPATQAAVRDFQRKHGLAVDGVYGNRTNIKADALLAPKPAPKPKPAPAGLRKGSTGEAVRRVQAKLKSAYPLYAGKLVVDGKFGPATDAAVREFQRRAGLKVDGIVGPATLKRLGL